MDDSRLSELLSTYVTKRDSMAAEHRARKGGSGLFAPGGKGSGPFAFSRLIDDHAAQLRTLLPALSLAQMEALSELVNSALNDMRRIGAKS